MNRLNILLITITCAVFLACSDSKQSNDSEKMHSKGHHDHHHHQDMGSMEVSGSSIFNLESSWVNHNGDSIQLSQLDGGVKIISMVYTHCQFACPRIVADMKMIKEKLEANGVEQVEYVLVSIDPERDNPNRLRTFAKENNFDRESWTLLTSSEENIQELAVVLGVQYKAVSDTDFSHSNLITVLNASGEIIHRQEGLGTQPEETIAAVQEAIK